MEDKLGIIAIVIQENSEERVDRVNKLLHEYRKLIVGRMGIPYPKRSISLISLVVDGDENQINALSGKLGMIDEVQSKTTIAGPKR